MTPADLLEDLNESLWDSADQLHTIPIQSPIAAAALRKVQNGLTQVSIDLHRVQLAEAGFNDRPASTPA